MTLLLRALGLLVLGLLLDLLAIPPGPFPLAILIADLPFLWLVGGGGGRRWLLLAWIYGLLHFALALRWLGEIHPFQIVGVGVTLSVAYPLAAAAMRSLVRRGLPYLLVVPTVLVFEEMFRTVWMGGMPWPARSLSFAAFPGELAGVMLASSAGLGAYALSFLAGSTSAFVALLVPRFALSFLPAEMRPRRPVLLLFWPLAIGGLLVGGGLAWRHHARGVLALAAGGGEGTAPTLVAIQADIPQHLKHSAALGANMRVYRAHLDLTAQALADAKSDGRRVDVVLWPETMIPWPFVSTALAHRFPDEWENMLRILQHVKEVADGGDAGTRYLLGAIYLFRRGRERHERAYAYGTHDSLFLVDPSRVPPRDAEPPPPPPLGEEPSFFLARHDKHVLVPGGEYTPMGDLLPPLRAMRDLVSVIPPLDAGAEAQVPFPLTADPRGPRGGTVLCFELLFPARCRAWRRRGADVLLNAANYGWFGPTGFRAQVRAAAALRAVENGVSVVVAGNTGPTAFFDPLGRRYGKFVSRDGMVTERAGLDDTTYRPGYARARLIVAPLTPPYSRLGDAPWWVLGVGLVMVWVVRGLRARGGATAGAAGPVGARPPPSENL